MESFARLVYAGKHEGEILPDTVTGELAGPSQPLEGGAVKAPLRVTVLFTSLTASDVDDAVKGESPSDAESTLRDRYAIQDPEVDLSPGWAPWLPRFGFRINVVFRTPPACSAVVSPPANDDNAAAAEPAPTPRN